MIIFRILIVISILLIGFFISIMSIFLLLLLSIPVDIWLNLLDMINLSKVSYSKIKESCKKYIKHD